ncbi:hypothetical protein PIB30_007670 [Stylosanthes scabra]|uniref:Non-specific lipid-transfer protein n=1 Tax=Stylosanthes scabra TaxID=79078 RepID=A0ABU6W492_9FABA|nr:hypothetical protein [Stylosanthes scabra]
MKMPKAASTHHGVAMLLLVTIFILLSSCEAQDSETSIISCNEVISEAAPCASFLEEDRTEKPSQSCCDGVKKLSDDAGTQEDRTAICECLKQVLAKIKYDPKRVAMLPKLCQVSLTIPPIDQKTDCSK